ncbi:hypothetical protein Btru_021016 [Bulinus truncatus]|nr:hypothetical protein Btru_021016 [Bulinus truncatus]
MVYCISFGPTPCQGCPNTRPGLARNYARGWPNTTPGWPSTLPGVARHFARGGPTLCQGWPNTTPGVAQHYARGGPTLCQGVAQHSTRGGPTLRQGWLNTMPGGKEIKLVKSLKLKLGVEDITLKLFKVNTKLNMRLLAIGCILLAHVNFISGQCKVLVCSTGETESLYPQMIDPYLCTHLMYHNFDFTVRTVLPNNSFTEKNLLTFSRLNALKKWNPTLKTWFLLKNEVFGDFFYIMYKNSTSRKQYIQETINFLRRHNFDGVVLYITVFDETRSLSDKSKFVLLLQGWPSTLPGVAQHFARGGSTLRQGWLNTKPWVAQHYARGGSTLCQGWLNTLPGVAQHYARGGSTLRQGWPNTMPGVAENFARGGSTLCQGWLNTTPGVAQHYARGGPTLCQGWPNTKPWVAQHYARSGSTLRQGWPNITPGVAQHYARGGPTLSQGWPNTTPGVAQHYARGGPTLRQGWPKTMPVYVFNHLPFYLLL